MTGQKKKERGEMREEKDEVITSTTQSPRHIITSQQLPTFKETPQKAKNSPPATQWKGGVRRSREVVTQMPQGITPPTKGSIPHLKDKQLKINSPPESMKSI